MPPKIWAAWLQGRDAAPDLVRMNLAVQELGWRRRGWPLDLLATRGIP